MNESIQNNHTDTYFSTFGARAQVAGKTVLDVGCGDGYASKCFLEMGASSVDALEPGFKGQDRRPNHIHDLPVTFYTDWSDVIDKKYDLIWHHHVIEHVEDYFRFLRDIHSMLNPGGWMWMACPNMAAYTVFSPGHIHNFQSAQLIEVLRLTGFASADVRISVIKGQLRVRVPRDGATGYPQPMKEQLDATGRCDSLQLSKWRWRE